MALVNVIRKPSTLQAYQLVAQADMTTALSYLATRGYTGHVSLTRISGVLTWQLTLQADAGNDVQSGFINDWVVIENDTIATITPAAKAGSLYQVG